MTNLQNLILSIRNNSVSFSVPVPPENVNFGFTDGLSPPYVTVSEYSQTWDQDTGNEGVIKANVTVLCIGKNVDEAESVADGVNTYLSNNLAVTPQCIGILPESWETGQTDPNNLYQCGVKLVYTLWIDPTK